MALGQKKHKQKPVKDYDAKLLKFIALPVPVTPKLIFQIRLVIVLIAEWSFAFNPINHATVYSWKEHMNKGGKFPKKQCFRNSLRWPIYIIN